MDGLANVLYILVMPGQVQFTLDALRAIESHISIAYEGEPQPKMREVVSWNPYYTFWRLEKGSAAIEIGGRRYRVRAGEWILMPPQAQRHHVIDDSTVMLSLSFHFAWPSGEPVLRMDEALVGRSADEERLCSLARQTIHATDGTPTRTPQAYPVDAFFNVTSCFHAFLASACELVQRRGGSIVRPGEVDPRLVPILADLSSSPRIGPLPYETWRAKVGIGREQIDRLARRHLGMTLHAWRNRQLEREIRRRLISGTTAIKAVASELGFVDPPHFNRWCRQHLRLRPGQLRGGAA